MTEGVRRKEACRGGVPCRRGGWWWCRAGRGSGRWAEGGNHKRHIAIFLASFKCTGRVLPCVRPSSSIPQHTGWCWWATGPRPCSDNPATTAEWRNVKNPAADTRWITFFFCLNLSAVLKAPTISPSWLIFQWLEHVTVKGGGTYSKSGQNIGACPHGYSDEALQPVAKWVRILLGQRAGKVVWKCGAGYWCGTAAPLTQNASAPVGGSQRAGPWMDTHSWESKQIHAFIHGFKGPEGNVQLLILIGLMCIYYGKWKCLFQVFSVWKPSNLWSSVVLRSQIVSTSSKVQSSEQRLARMR